MPQTSLTAWLSKPARVQQSPPATEPQGHLDVNETNNGSWHEPNLVNETLPIPSDVPVEPPARSKDLQCTARQRNLPTNVELRACSKDDIQHLKRLNSLLLPIPYSESFYREIVEDPLTNNITLVAVWHDDPTAAGKDKGRLVGAIRCRLLAHGPAPRQVLPSAKTGPMLYLSTVVLLSPYRSHGIAACMLDVLVRRAVNLHGVSSVGAHVWDANLDGLEWYRRRGFKQVGREDDYYHRLKPQGAVVMQKDIGIMDLVKG